jgi:hypothetical protein
VHRLPWKPSAHRDINKDCFRIFDAVELSDGRQNFTEMKPVAQRPTPSFAQL